MSDIIACFFNVPALVLIMNVEYVSHIFQSLTNSIFFLPKLTSFKYSACYVMCKGQWTGSKI